MADTFKKNRHTNEHIYDGSQRPTGLYTSITMIPCDRIIARDFLRKGDRVWRGKVDGSTVLVKYGDITQYEFSNPQAARGFLESASRKMLRRGYKIETMRKNPTGTEKHLEYHSDD